MIELTHLQKVVERTTLIDIEGLTAVSHQITAVTGLIEPHKTAFLELLTGQTIPTAGTVRLDGLDPARQRADFARQVGALLPENGLYGRQTARQNLTFFCDLYGLPHGRADDILREVGLQDQADARAEDLAPGLARRLAFGRAILHQPAMLLLADPFAGCDRASVELLGRLMAQAAEAGTAVLLISNDAARILPLCQMVYVLENGRVAQQYQPQERGNQETLTFKIPARMEGKVVLVNPADILYATTEDGRTFLCTGDGRIPTHLTLTEVEERLSRSGFFRAHRSYLVNLQQIKEVIAYTRNSYTLILDNGGSGDRSEIPLSKGAARELRELLDY